MRIRWMYLSLILVLLAEGVYAGPVSSKPTEGEDKNSTRASSAPSIPAPSTPEDKKPEEAKVTTDKPKNSTGGHSGVSVSKDTNDSKTKTLVSRSALDDDSDDDSMQTWWNVKGDIV